MVPLSTGGKVVGALSFARFREEGTRTGRMEGRLTLYPTQEDIFVTVGNRTVPLEYALTAALAYTLEGSQAYSLELKGLFSGDFKIFKDSALRKMVVIGHSQGGLLTKLTAINSGNRFWDSTFKVPIDQLDVSPDTRELLRRSLFYKPLPFVHRVVFISTPHQGSHFTGGYISALLRRLISLPGTLLSPLQEVFQRSPEALTARAMGTEIPRSTDNITPDSPFIKTISSFPIAPGVIAHSIIAVANPEDPKEE